MREFRPRRGITKMSTPAKIGLVLLLGLIGFFMVKTLIAAVFNLVVPLAIIAGIGLILYSMINRRSLGSSRRYLP